MPPGSPVGGPTRRADTSHPAVGKATPARGPSPTAGPTLGRAATSGEGSGTGKGSGKGSGTGSGAGKGSGTGKASKETAGGAGSGRPARSNQRTWQLVIGGLGVLVLIAICGLSSYFMVADESHGQNLRTSGGPEATAATRDISSRAVDPEPLTVREVFPANRLVLNPEEAAYDVLKTQALNDCGAAVAGNLGALLSELGCSQVVRGTLRSPTGAYLVTAGIFNLVDKAGADRAHEQIKPIIDAETGRFQGMVAGSGTAPIGQPTAQVGWHVRGHYLVYAVIARVNGDPIGEEDPFARQILFDMIELHLRGAVLEQRATVPANPPPGAATPTSPG